MVMQTLNVIVTTASSVVIARRKALHYVGIYNLGTNIIHHRWGDGDATVLDKIINPNEFLALESQRAFEGDMKLVAASGTANVSIDLGTGD